MTLTLFSRSQGHSKLDFFLSKLVKFDKFLKLIGKIKSSMSLRSLTFLLTNVDIKRQLERAVDGAPSQIPTLKFLTPPQHPQVPSRGMTLATE